MEFCDSFGFFCRFLLRKSIFTHLKDNMLFIFRFLVDYFAKKPIFLFVKNLTCLERKYEHAYRNDQVV